MKVCPICSSTYGDKVDFCFQDGAPLVVGGPSAAPAKAPHAAAEEAPTAGVDVPDLPPWARPGGDADPTELPTSPLEPAVPLAPPTKLSPHRAPAPRVEALDETAPVPAHGDALAGAMPVGRTGLDDMLDNPTLIPPGELGEVTGELPTERVEPPPPVMPPAAAPAPAPVPQPSSEAADEEDRKAGALFPIAVVAALLLLGIGGGWALGLFGGDGSDRSGEPEVVAAAMPAAAPSPAPAPPVPEPEPEPEPEPASAEAAAPSAVAAVQPVPSAPASAAPAPAVAADPAPAAPAAASGPAPTAAPAEDDRSRRRRGGRRSLRERAKASASEAPAPTPAPAAGGGRLSVSTSPAGAQVMVDGKVVGKAPWTGSVSKGSHSVRAELNGHKAAARTVEVASSPLDINFTLRPVVVTGQVNIYGTPQAKVFIDGNPVGEIPVTALLSEGPHEFEVTTADGQRFSRKYDIKFSVPGVPVTITLIAQ